MKDIKITNISIRKVKPDGSLGRNLIHPSAPNATWLPDGALDNPTTRWEYVKQVWSWPGRWLRWRIGSAKGRGG